jgi:acetyl-CoA carboxylase biotin carboxyl carrier protein
MDLRYLKKLMEIFDSSTATRLEIEEEGIKVKVSKVEKGHSTVQMIPLSASTQSSAPQFEQSGISPASVEKKDIKVEVEESPVSKLHEIRSPIVGTFYRSPSPEAEPFVEVGARIAKGSVLCIVEAMKLMNEIERDIAGIVEKIMIENSNPVEFNQPMFLIRPE